MKVELIYGQFVCKTYKTKESALNAARRIAKKEKGLSCEIRIWTSENTARTECYVFDSDGNIIII